MHSPKIMTLVLAVCCGLGGAQAQEKDRPGRSFEDLDNSFRIDTGSTFRLRVEVDVGQVRVSRGRSEDQLRVRLAYDRDEYQHTLRYNEKRNTLDLMLDKQRWLGQHDSHNASELEVELPTGGELDLDFRIKAGEIEMQLGGLRLRDLSLETIAGEVNLDFDQPNQTTMTNLLLNTKIGESNFRRLGNARFRNAAIDGGIGELTIDFSGELLKEAVAEVDLDIGETTIILPRKAGTRLAVSSFMFLSHFRLPDFLRKEGRYYYSENYDDASQTFQLRISAGVGECRIERE
ncbi:MAG: cell wall-active antibiotics response protein [candidate division KSB1 bacterium]|nr:cell wall-active antibiotics response protein [candidate division KSB1 bacterium]MDZ7272806.1 cell wall-active antibiotics response protein [candidate division KSB1 bacterium]MDZ7284170.1 cell wall-active antibiotics response protein [candidate division KSB1 bacterium]MDZ7297432.1 cell wall-active antibiotics response protein [candidate division KSB1 bacterium]MDZ7308180.1 cell wall-active antibiotics response protein [candidate division KSB1 bacterium]